MSGTQPSPDESVRPDEAMRDEEPGGPGVPDLGGARFVGEVASVG